MPGSRSIQRPSVSSMSSVNSRTRKARLGIAFGCTGGRHRSVAIADDVARRIAGFWPGDVAVEHRDRDRRDVRT